MLFIHIGFHKTGSTTIQAALHAAGDARAYPLSRAHRQIAQHHLAMSILAGRSTREMETIRRRAERMDVVISSERLSLCDPAAVRAAMGPARIICYRRDMPSTAVSRYVQMTKRGVSAMDFDALYDTGELTFAAAPTLAAWARAFGADNVRVRSLAPHTLTGGDLLADFSAAVRPVGRVADRNISPGWRAAECVRAFSVGLGGTDEAARKAFVGGPLRKAITMACAEAGLTEPGAYLAEWQQAHLMEADRRDMDAIDALGVDALMSPLPPPPVRDFLPQASEIPTPELARILRLTRDRLRERRRGLPGL